jgi:hypothetical protein
MVLNYLRRREPVAELRYPFEMRLGGPQSWSGHNGEEKFPAPAGNQTLEPWSSGPWPVSLYFSSWVLRNCQWSTLCWKVSHTVPYIADMKHSLSICMSRLRSLNSWLNSPKEQHLNSSFDNPTWLAACSSCCWQYGKGYHVEAWRHRPKYSPLMIYCVLCT